MTNSSWYIIQTISGLENKVKKNILDQAEKKGISDLFEEIIIPSIEVPEIKKGKQVIVEKRVMPGYIMVKMNLTDDAWHIIKSTKSTGILGVSNKPIPVPESQIKKIFSQIEHKEQEVICAKVYAVGDSVEIIEGPFESLTGSIEEVDEKRARLKLSVIIFGRPTPVDLTFKQVKKVLV